MATKKISELEAITEADDSDVLAIVDVSEGKTNKITKNNLLIGAGHSIEMSLNENYQIVLKLKNTEGTELSTASIDLPNENSITDISYNNGKLTLTKQSGATTEVDITGLINGLVTESDFSTFTTALQETIGAINVKNEQQDEAIEENYKVITKLQEDVEDLTERVEDAENNQLTYTPTPATSHYLQDSADSRFRKFIPIGRTTQESTTGKQLFNINGNYTDINKGITSVNGEEVTVSGTNTSSSTVGTSSEAISINQNTDYIINGKIKSGLSSARIAVQFKENESDNWGGYTAIITGIGTINKTINSGNYSFIRFLFYCWTSTPSTATPAVFDEIMLSTTGGDYEPYTGGEPAPNPNYPYAIKNTGDNGSVNEKVQNFNIWDEQWLNGYYNVEGKFITSNENICSKNPIYINSQLSIYCKVPQNMNCYICQYSKDGTFIRRDNFANQIFTPNSQTNYLHFNLPSSYGATYKNDICINVSNLALNGTYVPHSEQNISFPLAQGQKFYEGSHPDDDEKVHHKRGEKVFDGTEDMFYNTSNQTCRIWLDEAKEANDNALSNYFKYNKVSVGTMVNGDFRISPTSNRIGVFFKNTELTSEEAWKNWFATKYANGTPVRVVFELAEEQTEDFTEEQQTAWKEWKKARTYKNVTHISSSDETPANVEIEYVQDTKTYIDNKVTALTNAITSLGGNV